MTTDKRSPDDVPLTFWLRSEEYRELAKKFAPEATKASRAIAAVKKRLILKVQP